MFKIKDFDLNSNINLIICGIKQCTTKRIILQHKIQQLQKIFMNKKNYENGTKRLNYLLKMN